jgi:hypothetical protein
LTRVLAAAAVLAGILLASTASAYVVVTSDNLVFEVPSRPEVRGEMVYFTLNGAPVSLRVYDINVQKTNELNFLVERGGDSNAVMAAMRQMGGAAPSDDRLIVSSRLEVAVRERQEATHPATRLARHGHGPAVSPSFSSDRPGRREPMSSSGRTSFSDSPGRPASARSAPPRESFETEARAAMREAERRVDSGRTAPSAAPSAASSRDAGRAAELDAEIKAEQEHLQKLTSGEAVVDDLERAIDRSMEKIRRLQKERDRLGEAGAAAPAPAGSRESFDRYESSGRYEGGSREERMEREIMDLEAKLARLRQQQSAIPAGDRDEREITDELIGETEYRIDKLKRKLERLGER